MKLTAWFRKVFEAILMRFGVSTSVVTVAAPVLTGSPSISGTAQVGQVLTATHGSYTGSITGYIEQWFSGGSPISLATGLTYTAQNSDLGNSLTYREFAFNGGGSSASGTSNALGPVTTPPATNFATLFLLLLEDA